MADEQTTPAEQGDEEAAVGEPDPLEGERDKLAETPDADTGNGDGDGDGDEE